MFALMNEFVHTEVHCATGRIDCTVEVPDKIYLFEFKHTSNGSAADALKQIKEKSYADRYAGSGKKVVTVDAIFDDNKATFKYEYRINPPRMAVVPRSSDVSAVAETRR